MCSEEHRRSSRAIGRAIVFLRRSRLSPPIFLLSRRRRDSRRGGGGGGGGPGRRRGRGRDYWKWKDRGNPSHVI